MLEALIGIIIGIAICTFIFILDVRDSSKGTSILQTIERPVQRQFQPKGAVLEAPDDISIAQQEIIERNTQEGRDTPLEELL